jgi:integrating conjugative element membrane protein (TIGR03747 family)
MFSILKIPFHVFLWLFFTILLMLLLESLSQCIFGQKFTLAQSEKLLIHEKMVMSEQLKKEALSQSIQHFFDHSLSNRLSIPISDHLLKLENLKSNTKTILLKNQLRHYGQQLEIFKQIVFNLLHVELLRFIVFLSFIPLFGLLGIIGFVDGLAQRHLRKLQGARESSVWYQHAKTGVSLSFLGAGIVYIGLPLILNPLSIFLPCAVLFSITLAIAIRAYKKYL